MLRLEITQSRLTGRSRDRLTLPAIHLEPLCGPLWNNAICPCPINPRCAETDAGQGLKHEPQQGLDVSWHAWQHLFRQTMTQRSEKLSTEGDESGSGEGDVQWVATDMVWEENTGGQWSTFNQCRDDEQKKDP